MYSRAEDIDIVGPKSLTCTLMMTSRPWQCLFNFLLSLHLPAPTTKGKGAVALAIHQGWIVVHSKPIEARTLIAHCVSGDKQNLTVVVAHFSQVADERPQ